MPGLDTEERASSASGQSLIWDDDVRGNGGEWYSEEGESEAPVDDDPIRSDSEFMLGNAGPIVIFDRHSGPSSTRERRSHLDDAAIQFTIDTKEKMSSKPSRISESVLEIAPSASGSGSRIQKQMSSNETIEIIKKEYRTAHAKAHEERSTSQKAAEEVENGMLGRISGFSDTIIYDRSATVPGFSSFYKGLFIRLFPISIEVPVNCFTLKILLDVLDAGTYATQDVTFSHEHVSVVTRRLEGQQSFSWTAICLIITVSKWYKPRTVFDLVSCESVLKWREGVASDPVLTCASQEAPFPCSPSLHFCPCSKCIRVPSWSQTNSQESFSKALWNNARGNFVWLDSNENFIEESLGSIVSRPKSEGRTTFNLSSRPFSPSCDLRGQMPH